MVRSFLTLVLFVSFASHSDLYASVGTAECIPGMAGEGVFQLVVERTHALATLAERLRYERWSTSARVSEPQYFVMSTGGQMTFFSSNMLPEGIQFAKADGVKAYRYYPGSEGEFHAAKQGNLLAGPAGFLEVSPGLSLVQYNQLTGIRLMDQNHEPPKGARYFVDVILPEGLPIVSPESGVWLVSLPSIPPRWLAPERVEGPGLPVKVLAHAEYGVN
ncbi:hypothetical protein K2X33_02205 [bacterium]|nr:hypothetical protein [bacterium]